MHVSEIAVEWWPRWLHQTVFPDEGQSIEDRLAMEKELIKLIKNKENELRQAEKLLSDLRYKAKQLGNNTTTAQILTSDGNFKFDNIRGDLTVLDLPLDQLRFDPPARSQRYAGRIAVELANCRTNIHNLMDELAVLKNAQFKE